MTKTQNVLTFLQELQKHKVINCVQLTGELGVHPRTIYRYLRELRDAGYKFRSKSGQRGYVELVDD